MAAHRPRRLAASWVAASFLLFVAAPARALISVASGTYDVPALVTISSGRPVAVFNGRTLSRLEVTLTGPVADKLRLEGLSGLRLKLRFARPVTARTETQAELLSASPLEPGAEIPLLVGNDLKPSGRKGARR